MTVDKYFLNAMAVLASAGGTLEEIKLSVLGEKDCLVTTDQYGSKHPLPLGLYGKELPPVPLSNAKWQSRNNQMAVALLQQIEDSVSRAIKKFGSSRIGVVIGTSTSSIAEVEEAIAFHQKHNELPDSYHYSLQEMGNTAGFVSEVLGLSGPAYGISTACSSGAKAIASGRRLVKAGICDAVIVGGIDSICQLTVQGFSSLEAVSQERCNPFSQNRKGINIGEGGALFLLSKEQLGVELVGIGESSDAHHISAPDPLGGGAIKCMQAALSDAKLDPSSIGYINLHGTATELNDQMESRAVHHVFGDKTLCSSTKPFTGHTLGAAGAIEAAICCAVLDDNNFLPKHVWDGCYDTELPKINLIEHAEDGSKAVKYALSNSFAFGGNNISLILGANK